MLFLTIVNLIKSTEIIKTDFFKNVFELSDQLDTSSPIKRVGILHKGKEKAKFLDSLSQRISSEIYLHCMDGIISHPSFAVARMMDLLDETGSLLRQRFQNDSELTNFDFRNQLEAVIKRRTKLVGLSCFEPKVATLLSGDFYLSRKEPETKK